MSQSLLRRHPTRGWEYCRLPDMIEHLDTKPTVSATYSLASNRCSTVWRPLNNFDLQAVHAMAAQAS
jgi:hypothetical protein